MDPAEAPAEASLHGVLVDVSGIGVLLLGGERDRQERVRAGSRHARSPPGRRRRGGDLAGRIAGGRGRGPARIRHHMEIRGLGIINIRDLFGVAAVRDRKRIELVIQLEAWRPGGGV